MITLIAATVLAPTTVVERLANGATLVAIQLPGAQAFSAQTFVRGGSAYEPPGESGVSHLLEHLMFVDGEADRIAENAGLLLNATTFREFMRLHTFGPGESWKAGISAVARLLKKPLSTYAGKEWAVIEQENALALLDPDEVVHRALWRTAAGSSPWSLPPMGEVGKGHPKATDATFSSYVAGPNIVAVASGGSQASEMLAELRLMYGSLPSGPTLAPPSLPSWATSVVDEADRHGISFAAPGFDNPQDFVGAEVACEALTSPSRLLSAGLEAKLFLTPSSRGALGVISFRAFDGAPGLGVRVRQALASPITAAEYVDAKARCRQRYVSAPPASQALVVGLSVLFTGSVIDFAAEIDRLEKGRVDAFAEQLRK